MSVRSINPATGAITAEYREHSAAEVQVAADEAHAAFAEWRRLSVTKRAIPMRAAARQLRQGVDEYARLMAREMGKPLREGVAEVEKCAWVCEYFAEHAEEFLRPEPVETNGYRSFVTFQPIGVVLAIMPWNFPFWQVFRAAAPALMAGNTMLLKHAGGVPGCALAVEQIFRDAGFPRSLFRTLLVRTDRVAGIIDNPRVKAVTLTGSTRAGRAVASRAGKAIKKTVLELGGSDAYVILEDADLDLAVDTCVTSRLANCGQSCIAAKRFVVVDDVHPEFERRVIEAVQDKRMGDPFDEATDIGPMARIDLRDELHRQVRDSIEAGARCVLGGTIPEGPGAFYPPTVLTDVGPGMPAYDEELFGPVAAIIPVRDERAAIDVANDSPYGLGAAVFTRDRARGTQLAQDELVAGCCFVNARVKSDPRLPFGGVKESGYGRELSQYGIREFVNIKTIYVA